MAPTIECPTDFTTTNPNTWIHPNVSDTVDMQLDVICNPSSDVPFESGTTTVNCTATDDAGNSKSCTFEVTLGKRNSLSS